MTLVFIHLVLFDLGSSYNLTYMKDRY